MSLEVRFVQGIPVIEAEGKLTIDHDAETVRRIVRDLLEEGQRKIVFSGEGISYLDSTGLEALVGSYLRAHKVGAEFKLAGFQSKPRQILDMTRLSSIMTIHPSPEEAIASFNR